jgi:hypothetical protein
MVAVGCGLPKRTSPLSNDAGEVLQMAVEIFGNYKLIFNSPFTPKTYFTEAQWDITGRFPFFLDAFFFPSCQSALLTVRSF